MAGGNMYIRIMTPSRLVFAIPDSWFPPKYDNRYARTGMIQGPGKTDVQIADAGTENKWLYWSYASSIGGYKKLLRSTSGLFSAVSQFYDGKGTPNEQTIEEFATDSTGWNNKQCRGNTVTASYYAKHDFGPPTRNLDVVYKVYHRTSGGTETLLDSFTHNIGTYTSYTKVTGSITMTQQWGPSERIVVKFIGIDRGVPT